MFFRIRALLALLVITATTSVFAQWTSVTTPNVGIYYTDFVGIGANTAPAQALHVFANYDGMRGVLVQNTSTGGNAGALFQGQSNTGTFTLLAHGSGHSVSRYGVSSLGGWSELTATAGEGLALGTGNAKPVVIGTDNTARIYIDSTGNIGFGTTVPKGMFHLYSTATSDAVVGMGPDSNAGPALNIGYGGASLGRSAGFINVRPDALATAPNPSLRFMTESVQRMIIANTGKVGIGAPFTPTTLLHVRADVNSSDVLRVSNVNAGTSAYAAVQFGINGNDLAGAIFQNSTNNAAYGGGGSVNFGSIANYPTSIITGNQSRVFVMQDGSVGIGRVPAGTTFQVTGASASAGGSRQMVRLYDSTAMAAGVGAGIELGGKYNSAGDYTQFANIKGIKANAISNDIQGKLVLTVMDGAGYFPEVATLTPGKLAVTGDITATGSITGASVIGATYQDVAEWVPATTHMEPGTVVVLNRQHRNEVMPSAHAYDTAVAGVVSAQPGVILGIAGDSKAQVATTGRVKVHVDATAGAIDIGDLLVTGNKPGTAMKSQPVDLGGVQFHRPGTVIGKALEPLPDGEGEILVLLSLQ